MNEEHRHHWLDSREFSVGSLYPAIYPWYCLCGAFMSKDKTILEPKTKKDVDKIKSKLGG